MLKIRRTSSRSQIPMDERVYKLAREVALAAFMEEVSRRNMRLICKERGRKHQEVGARPLPITCISIKRGYKIGTAV